MGVMSFPWVRRSQSHVSDLFIFGLRHNHLCFVKALFFIPCSPLAIYASSVISRF